MRKTLYCSAERHLSLKIQEWYKMSGKVNLSETNTYMLWGRAAGRCEFAGCNKILYRDTYSMKPLNLADRAHIVARKVSAARGDAEKSAELVANPGNVMLLCKDCHKRIDTNENDFPIELLLDMKAKHERRIELQTGFTENNKSFMITYAANVGNLRNPIDCQSAAMSMKRYGRVPAEPHPIDLSLSGSATIDSNPEYWRLEERNLENKFQQKLFDRISDTGDIRHSSLFAIAPVPLLIKLGTLFTDKCPVDVYQKHREPDTWDWLSGASVLKFQISRPAKKCDNVALVLSLSDLIPHEDICKTLGDDVSFWDISLERMDKDCIKAPADLAAFRDLMRHIFGAIKTFHGNDQIIHVFAAIPISTAIELGRVWMPRADLPLQTYNRDNERIFRKAITIGRIKTK